MLRSHTGTLLIILTDRCYSYINGTSSPNHNNVFGFLFQLKGGIYKYYPQQGAFLVTVLLIILHSQVMHLYILLNTLKEKGWVKYLVEIRAVPMDEL